MDTRPIYKPGEEELPTIPNTKNDPVQSLEKIDDYRIIKELGRGGMGRVFLAQDEVIERQVALKTIQLELLESEHLRDEFRKRFRKEASICGNLNHRHIVTIHKMGEDQGRLFIAMEYIEGRSLLSLIGLPAFREKIEVVIVQICEAMAYAHERGVIHRDIKPANIMWTLDEQIKILDFGIARLMVEDATKLTGTHCFLGTPDYASPEQVHCEAVDQRSDIYSLGLLFHQILTGALPQLAPETGLLLGAVEAVDGSRLEGQKDMLSAIFWKALHPEREIRYQHVALLARDLVGCLQLYGPPKAGYCFDVMKHPWADGTVEEDLPTDEVLASLHLPDLPGVTKKVNKPLWVAAFVLPAVMIFFLIQSSFLEKPSTPAPNDQSAGFIPLEKSRPDFLGGDASPSGARPSEGIGADRQGGGGPTAVKLDLGTLGKPAGGGGSNTVVGRDLIINGTPGKGGDSGEPAGREKVVEKKTEHDHSVAGDPNLQVDTKQNEIAMEVKRLQRLVSEHKEVDFDQAIFFQEKILELVPDNQEVRDLLFEMYRKRLPDSFGPTELDDLVKRFPKRAQPLVLEAKKRTFLAHCVPENGVMLDFLLISKDVGRMVGKRQKFIGISFQINGRNTFANGALEYFFSREMSLYDRFNYNSSPFGFRIQMKSVTKPLNIDRVPLHDLVSASCQEPSSIDNPHFQFHVVYVDDGKVLERIYKTRIDLNTLFTMKKMTLDFQVGDRCQVYLIHEMGYPLCFSDERLNKSFHADFGLVRNEITNLDKVNVFEGDYALLVVRRKWFDEKVSYDVVWTPLTLDGSIGSLVIQAEKLKMGEQEILLEPITSFFSGH